MRVKLIILGCILIFFISSCLDQSGINKNNHLGSRSLVKSQEHGVYVSHYALLPENSNCQLDFSLCWMESAWTPKYSLFQGKSIKRLDFYNVYFKIEKSYEEVLVRESQKEKWRNSSIITEPDLGFYFQLNKSTDLDSVEIKLISNDRECLYHLASKEGNH